MVLELSRQMKSRIESQYLEFCQLSMPGVSPCDARTLYDGL
jgi:hypothetical protein